MANYNVLTLSEPVTDFVATTSPETINVQCSLTEDAQRKRVWAVCKAGGVPAHPYDGVRVLMTGDSLVTAMILGLVNDTEYGVRLFVEGAYGYQTALEGATAAATPRAGQYLGDMPDGENAATISLKESGTDAVFVVTKHNYSESGGTLIVCRDLYDKRKFNASGSFTVYNGSDADTWVNGPYLDLFDTAIKEKLVSVAISSYESSSVSRTLTRKGFFLAVSEVTDPSGNIVEGDRLAYFGDAQSRIKTYGGTASTWLTRTCYNGGVANLHVITATGAISNTNQLNKTHGSLPAFVLPSDMLFSITPNSDGSYSPIL